MKGEAQFQAPRQDFVDVEDESALDAWARCMQVSRAELLRAVEIAGPTVGSVYDHLQRLRINGMGRPSPN